MDSGDIGGEGDGLLVCIGGQELLDSGLELCVEGLGSGSVEAIDGDVLSVLCEEREAVGHG